MKWIIFIIFLLFAIKSSFCQRLKIAVFYNLKVNSVVISTYLGKYEIIGDGVFYTELLQNDALQFIGKGDSVIIRNINGKSVQFKEILLKGTSQINSAKYKPINLSIPQRYYDDDMMISSKNGNLFFLNLVEFDNYICGVVETESGYQASKEFYKTQAILCRTFALENLGKHYQEGFHLCDDVHCQAYKGKNYSLSFHSIIAEAVNETHNLVIVDTNNMVITAAFHANCGGQTVNSEDVWTKAKPYLRSVSDPYCIHQRNTAWEKNISINEWNEFLKLYYPHLINQTRSWNFSQTSRKAYFKINCDSIWLRRIREHFQLRSTFFSIIHNGNNIVFKGKGFGHGVGLCQDGAMQMAKRGMKAEEIIRFYYQNVRVVPFTDLPLYQSILNINNNLR